MNSSDLGIFEEQLRERLKRDDAELSYRMIDVIDSLRTMPKELPRKTCVMN